MFSKEVPIQLLRGPQRGVFHFRTLTDALVVGDLAFREIEHVIAGSTERTIVDEGDDFHAVGGLPASHLLGGEDRMEDKIIRRQSKPE